MESKNISIHLKIASAKVPKYTMLYSVKAGSLCSYQITKKSCRKISRWLGKYARKASMAYNTLISPNSGNTLIK